MASVARLRLHTKRFGELLSAEQDPGYIVGGGSAVNPDLHNADPASQGAAMVMQLHATAGGRETPQGRGSLPASSEDICPLSPQFDVDWIQSPEGLQGGDHKCVAHKLVCLDQGMVVMHDPQYNMQDGLLMPTFDITTLQVPPWASLHPPPLSQKCCLCARMGVCVGGGG
jgi:hypothetical protein